MRMIFFACQQVGVDCIEYALGKGVEVPVVYTYELIMDKTYGYDSVSDYCRERGIPCVQNGSPDPAEVARLAPDMAVSVYYRKILREDVFSLPRLGTVNIHPSLLPEYRGPIPTVWALLHGRDRTGVTLHHIDKGVDTGDIISQAEVPIAPEDTGYTLYRNCMTAGAGLFARMVDDLLDGREPQGRPQPPGGSYYGSMDDSLRLANWKSPGADIVNRARAFSRPYTGLEARLLNKHVIIWKARELDDPSIPVQKPGRVVDIRDGKYVVSVADGVVVLEDIEIFPELTETEREVYLRAGINFS